MFFVPLKSWPSLFCNEVLLVAPTAVSIAVLFILGYCLHHRTWEKIKKYSFNLQDEIQEWPEVSNWQNCQKCLNRPTKWNAKECIKKKLHSEVNSLELKSVIIHYISSERLPSASLKLNQIKQKGNSLPNCIPFDSIKDPVHSESHVHKAGLAITASLFARS